MHLTFLISDVGACVTLCLQVFLAGYSHAFRYCPAGQHVEYREASRTPHEGAVEYISVDSHKGAGKCVLHSQTYRHTFSLRFSAVPAPEKGLNLFRFHRNLWHTVLLHIQTHMCRSVTVMT